MEEHSIDLLASADCKNASSPKEIELFESLLDACDRRLVEMGIPRDLIILKANQNGSAVCFADFHNILIYIRARKSQQQFAFPVTAEAFLPEWLHSERKKSQPQLIYISVDNINTLLCCCDAFLELISLAANKYHTFDCCGMYEQCSDVRRCINSHDDALGCTYRKRLKEGKVFYGKNRNV